MADAALKRRLTIATVSEEAACAPAGPVERYPGASLTTTQLANLAAIVVAETIPVERLLLRERARGGRRLAHGRTWAMALVHLVCGRSQEDVARAFRRNRTTASNHMEKIEELNDVPEHEAFWDALCLRFQKYVELMETPRAEAAWLRALAGIERAMDAGDLEGEAVDQAKHVLGVFWRERAGGE